jgi:hypothetical protein
MRLKKLEQDFMEVRTFLRQRSKPTQMTLTSPNAATSSRSTLVDNYQLYKA